MFGRSLEISAPKDVMVTHSVSPSDQLTAELSWSNGVSVEGLAEYLVKETVDITTEIEIVRPEQGRRTGTDIRSVWRTAVVRDQITDSDVAFLCLYSIRAPIIIVSFCAWT